MEREEQSLIVAIHIFLHISFARIVGNIFLISNKFCISLMQLCRMHFFNLDCKFVLVFSVAININGDLLTDIYAGISLFDVNKFVILFRI